MDQDISKGMAAFFAGRRLAPTRIDVRDLCGYLLLLCQSLHREDADLLDLCARVDAAGSATPDDFRALASAVRGALLYQSHAVLMLVAWVEQVADLRPDEPQG